MVLLLLSAFALVLFSQAEGSPHRVRASAARREARISRDELALLFERELYGASA